MRKGISKHDRRLDNPLKCFTCLSAVTAAKPREKKKPTTIEKKRKSRTTTKVLPDAVYSVAFVPRQQIELKLSLPRHSAVSSSISTARSFSGGTCASPKPEHSQQSGQRPAELTVQEWLRKLRDRDTLLTSNICHSETEEASSVWIFCTGQTM